MSYDHPELHHKPGKEEKYKQVFEEQITPLARSVESTLERLANPGSYTRPSIPIKDAPVLFIADMLTYSFYTVFMTVVDLASMSQHLSPAILCRSLIECMGNMHWIAEGHDEHERKQRAELLFNQAEKVYALTTNKISSVPSLQSLGAGSINNRIKDCGDGWPIIYSHLSSYSHMDAGFAIHYNLNETLGMRNLFMVYACLAAEQLIADALRLGVEMPEQFKQAIQKELDHIENLSEKIVVSSNSETI